MTGAAPEVSGIAFWKTVFESMRSTAITSRVQYVVGVQWAVWLANCQLKTIKEFQVHSCLRLLGVLQHIAVIICSSIDDNIYVLWLFFYSSLHCHVCD